MEAEVSVARKAILVLSVLLLTLSSQGCVVVEHDHDPPRNDAAWARYQRDYERWRVERAAWERRHARPARADDWPRPQGAYAPSGYAASRSDLAAVGVAEEADWTLPAPPPVQRGLELTWAPARTVVVTAPDRPCPPRPRARRIVEYQPRPTVVCAPTYPSYRTTVCYPAPVVVRRSVVCAPAPVVCAPAPVCRPAPVYRSSVSTGWSVSVGGGGGVRVGWGAGFGRCR